MSTIRQKDKSIMEQLYLGIELGSTRVKSILLDENGTMLSSGFSLWENKLVQGYWTYSLEEAKKLSLYPIEVSKRITGNATEKPSKVSPESVSLL